MNKLINKGLVIAFLAISTLVNSCTNAGSKGLQLKSGSHTLTVNTGNMQLQFEEKKQGIMVPGDTVSGLFINDRPVTNANVLSNDDGVIVLEANTSNNRQAKVKISFENGIATVMVEPGNEGENKVSLRFGGMPVAHGLGDAGGWNKTFDLAGAEEKQFTIENNGGGKRWLSTFTIFPKNSFAGVFFDRGKKSVTLSENTYQLNTEREGKSTFYFFVGDSKQIYANYKKIRNQNGYEDIKPKSRLFELGWESWDALGWNTNQFTVKDILDKFHKEGYPIRWAVTGSGFWDVGGTTTSFGRFGKKFPDTGEFKNWMHRNDIYWMIGLRTNFVPSGGPFYPKTKKRDKNLKVKSYYGNDLSDEAFKKGYLLTDKNGQVRTITSGVFPIVPCYLLDGNIPGAAAWYQKHYSKWGVDGIKEDTMMDLDEETSIFNKPMEAIANEGGHVMARCGEFSAPGTLLRINDTGVQSMKGRTTINYLQYAASGMPNVYSDVCGVHNMHNVKAIDANIRHSWLLSLTAGMAVGAYPSKWSAGEQKTFKKTVDFHYELVPYLYSAGMMTHETGFPYTLTPLSIAFSNDTAAVESDKFQWMIGESVLATPLLKNYKEGKKDIYLPEGVWYDWETGKRFEGPVTLSDYELPLEKVPCFVGGKGIVILRQANTDQLLARVYDVNNEGISNFYTLKEGEKYTFEVAAKQVDKATVKEVKTGKEIQIKKGNGFIEFPIVEGNSYQIK
ncbi:MAG: glycoside hydrolase family 31 protein [Carboxylicivirga sp.]|jgi:alpha-glucosidase (family GH31 glycosyl hydrolase)|nr:glycoside hydrolase family 31 protein [Carboxylicivirga sp.]